MSVRPYSRCTRVVGCVMESSCEFWCKEKRAFESIVFISFNLFPPQLGLLMGEIPLLLEQSPGMEVFPCLPQ